MARVVGVLLALTTATTVAWVVLWLWAPTASAIPFVLLALTPVAAVVGLVLAVVTLSTRRWVVGTAALVAALVLVAVVAPRAVPDRFDDPAVGRRPLVLATANLEFGGADAAALVDLVRTERVDVLSVQELTPAAEQRLAGAGLFVDLPFRLTRPRSDAGGTGLISRYPLGRSPIVLGPSVFEQVTARVAAPGVPVDVVATHPAAPVFDGPIASRWPAEIGALPTRAPGETPLIVAGDLNATLDHRPLRDLLARGSVDAASSVGAGLDFTWPTDQPVPPFAAIDHVLLSGEVVARDAHVRRLAGTDHAALVVELGVGPSSSAD